jgi:hypothetical protein
MERDAAISHGASSFLRERLMLVSDGYQTAFCKTCGTFAIYDGATERYKDCRLCGDRNYGRCTIPYAYKLLVHLLAAPGINLRPEFVTSEEYAEKLFRTETQFDGVGLDDIEGQLKDADELLEDETKENEDEGLDTDFADVYDF